MTQAESWQRIQQENIVKLSSCTKKVHLMLGIRGEYTGDCYSNVN